MTKILFIIVPNFIDSDSMKNLKKLNARIIPYGILSITTYLKKNYSNNIDIKIIDCNLYEQDDYITLIKNTIKNFNPDIIGLSMTFDDSYKYLNTMKFIKDVNPESIIILGGVSASFSYKEIINTYDYIDAICYTEGEIPILQLVKCKDEGINRKWLLENHISFVTKKSLLQNRVPESSFVKNLDDVIDIDYSLLDIERYQMLESFSPYLQIDKNKIKSKKHFWTITSRGCPYKCVFCATHTLYNNKIRYANVDKIISHIKYLVDKYGMNYLTIYDEQLLLNKERAKELFRKLVQFNLRIDAPNGLSVSFIDDEMAHLMKNAGFDTLVLALESGSDYMLKKVIHKPYDIKIVKPLIKILRKYNFFIISTIVLGLPGETEIYRQETIDFVKDIGIDWISINPALPLRGSELYNICIKNEYIEKNSKLDDPEYGMRSYTINAPPHLTPEIINRTAKLMNYDINFVDNYRMKTGDYQTGMHCFEDVIERVPDHAFAYYYLSKAQEKLGLDILARYNYKKYIDIISKDKIWKEYANYFKLEQ